MSRDGAGFVWQKQNKSWFFFRKWPHTSVEGSTNAVFVAKLVGYKAEDRQQKVFIENFTIKKMF